MKSNETITAVMSQSSSGTSLKQKKLHPALCYINTRPPQSPQLRGCDDTSQRVASHLSFHIPRNAISFPLASLPSNISRQCANLDFKQKEADHRNLKRYFPAVLQSLGYRKAVGLLTVSLEGYAAFEHRCLVYICR